MVAFNFNDWVRDNKEFIDGGFDALEKVVDRRHEIACAAAVRWLRDTSVTANDVVAKSGELSSAVVSSCESALGSVMEDCAKMYAGSRKAEDITMMAYVSYSIIGIKAAQSIFGS